MRKILNVAEKNAVAKEMAKILSKGSFSNIQSPAKYNMNYTFSYNLLNEQVVMIATSVAGHVYSLDFDQSLRQWQMEVIPRLFDAPLFQNVVNDQSEKIIKNLKTLAKGCDTLIIWTDCDREGEYIGQSVVDVCLPSNRFLTIKRARFSEVTHSSLSNALQNLGQINQKEVDSVKCRIELDLRIGASFTRMQSIKCKLQQSSSGQQTKGNVISYGPCQFPTLGLVVERYKEIEKFIPEKFWKLERNTFYFVWATLSQSCLLVNHRIDEFNVSFTWERGHLFCQKTCETFHNICKLKDFGTVVDLTMKQVLKKKPFPMDTIKMEKMASTYLHMSSKTTMNLAEKLYTTGYISYPRTETTLFPASINLKKLVEKHTNDPKYGNFAHDLLSKAISTRSGSKFDKAHPPIHPLKPGNDLQGDSARLFEMITRHFLACCSEDAVGNETVVVVDVSGEKFSTHGLQIIEKNFLEVYPYIKWNENKLPNYVKGQILKPIRVDKKDGETSPPNLLTESDLISLMEKHGIGTDATHAEHIAKIQERGYVEVIKKHFVPKELGLALIEGYQAMGYDTVYSPALRASFEKKLSAICKGEVDKSNWSFNKLSINLAVVSEMIQKYKQLYNKVVDNISTLIGYVFDYSNGTKKVDPNIVNKLRALRDITQRGSSVRRYVGSNPGFRPKPTKRNAPSSKTTGSTSRKVSTCGICHQTGHTKRSCPRRAC